MCRPTNPTLLRIMLQLPPCLIRSRRIKPYIRKVHIYYSETPSCSLARSPATGCLVQFAQCPYRCTIGKASSPQGLPRKIVSVAREKLMRLGLTRFYLTLYGRIPFGMPSCQVARGASRIQHSDSNDLPVPTLCDHLRVHTDERTKTLALE
jgi:hypothetical protein